MEAFSMLLIAYSYDGKIFSMDDVYYQKDFVDDSIKFPKTRKFTKQAMLIFIDKFGNEYRTTYGG